jgi:NTE family protein
MKKYIIVFLLSLPFFSEAQHRAVIRNLVFEGSGIRGIAYCGSLREMESLQMMQNIEKVGGTSAGAIMALAVSLGYSANEIEEMIGKMNFRKLNDGRYFFAGGIRRTQKFFGWYRGVKMEKWLEEMIARKTGDPNTSFRTLSQKGFRDLYVTGTCLNKQDLVIFSKHTYPDMKIKDAVRISMSIPLYYEAVFIDKSGSIQHHPRDTRGLDIMIDGGLIGNFPIRLFDSAGITNPATLGFRIDSDDQIINDQTHRKLAPLPVSRFSEYMNALYNMVIENLNRQRLGAEDWQRTVSISDGTIRPRVRKLSAKEINVLIRNAEHATKEYFNTSHN